MAKQMIFKMTYRVAACSAIALVVVSVCHMVLIDSNEVPAEGFAVPLAVLIAAVAYLILHPELLRDATTPDGTEMPWINPATGKEMLGGPGGIDTGGDTYGHDSYRPNP